VWRGWPSRPDPPIVPFYLTGTERIFAGGRPRLMRRVRMVFGEPIAVTQLENPTRADLVTLTSRVVNASDRLGGVPVTPDDCD